MPRDDFQKELESKQDVSPPLDAPLLTVVDGGMPDAASSATYCPHIIEKTGDQCKKFTLKGYTHCGHHLSESERFDRLEKANMIRPRDITGFTQIFADEGVNLRLNLRGAVIEVSTVDDPEWTPINDAMMDNLHARISISYKAVLKDGTLIAWELSNAKWQRLTNAAAYENRCDPFIAWLETRPAWDNLDRVEDMIFKLWPDAGPRDLARWCSKFLVLAAIIRAYNPGAPMKAMPVLIGPQDCGKSILIERLAIRPEWFTSAVCFDDSAKTNDERTEGVVFAEFAEFAGGSRSQIDKQKAYISDTRDGRSRKAYARTKHVTPRCWVPVATANDTGTGTLPKDSSGYVRYVTIETGNPQEMAWQWDEHYICLLYTSPSPRDS